MDSLTKYTKRPAVLSGEVIRRQLLSDLALPPALLRKAFQRLNEQLDAQKTEIVSYKGVVTDKVNLLDNNAVQGAIDKVFSVAGIYAREKDVKPTPAGIKIEVGIDGGVRIIVGGENGGDAGDELNDAIPMLVPTVTPAILDEKPPIKVSRMAGVITEKVKKKINFSPELWKILSDESDEVVE